MGSQSPPSDILDQIVGALPCWRSETRQTYLACLQVCKAWYQPFKAALWSAINAGYLCIPPPPPLPGQAYIEREPWYGYDMRKYDSLLQSLSVWPRNGLLVRSMQLHGPGPYLPLLSATSSSLRKLHIIEQTMEEPSGSICFPELTELDCSNTGLACLNLLLAHAPKLERLKLHMKLEPSWKRFSFLCTPSITNLDIECTRASSDGLIDSLLGPIAPKLESFSLVIRESGDEDLSSHSSGVHRASSWTAIGENVFPKLRELHLGGTSLSGAFYLISRASSLEEVGLADAIIGGSLTELLEQLPATLQRLALRLDGMDDAFAMAFRSRMLDAAWLPSLQECPRLWGLEIETEEEGQALVTAVKTGMHKRGVEVTDYEIVQALDPYAF